MLVAIHQPADPIQAGRRPCGKSLPSVSATKFRGSGGPLPPPPCTGCTCAAAATACGLAVLERPAAPGATSGAGVGGGATGAALAAALLPVPPMLPPVLLTVPLLVPPLVLPCETHWSLEEAPVTPGGVAVPAGHNVQVTPDLVLYCTRPLRYELAGQRVAWRSPGAPPEAVEKPGRTSA